MTHDEFIEACSTFAKEVMVPYLIEHDEIDHEGGFCSDERGNVLAYFAHMMGYDEEVWHVMFDRVLWYKRLHEINDHFEGDHGHLH